MLGQDGSYAGPHGSVFHGGYHNDCTAQPDCEDEIPDNWRKFSDWRMERANYCGKTDARAGIPVPRIAIWATVSITEYDGGHHATEMPHPPRSLFWLPARGTQDDSSSISTILRSDLGCRLNRNSDVTLGIRPAASLIRDSASFCAFWQTDGKLSADREAHAVMGVPVVQHLFTGFSAQSTILP